MWAYFWLISVVVFCKKSRRLLAISACFLAIFRSNFRAFFEALIPSFLFPNCWWRWRYCSFPSLIFAVFRESGSWYTVPSLKVAKVDTPKSMPIGSDTEWYKGGILSAFMVKLTYHLSAVRLMVNVWEQQLYPIASFRRNVPNVGIFMRLPAIWNIGPLLLSTVKESPDFLRLKLGNPLPPLKKRSRPLLKAMKAFW